MVYKDRTSEFNAVAEATRTRQSASKNSKKSAKNQRTQFAIIASQIGKEIYETSEKLNKLTKLAKKKSLFDDPAVEIEELTFIIKQSIQNLNQEIVTLKQFSKSQGSSSNQHEAHSDTIVHYLNSKLAHTAKGFKEILQVRTENLKTQQERRQKFTGSNTSPSSISTPPRQSVPRERKTRRAVSEDQSSLTEDSVMYANGPEDLPEGSARGDGHVALLIQSQADYTNSRLSAVEKIEGILVELGGIYQQLASLVAEQGSMIQRIDEDVESTLDHVEKGHDQLLKYLHGISSNRMLIVKIFLVLIVFAVIFIVFFL